jgi:hypothetical protein
MSNSLWSKRLLRYGGIALVIAVLLYLVWVGSNGWDFSTICAGVGLVLFVAAMIYLKQMDIKADRNIAQRIRAEYSSESQPQVFEIYDHLKTRELEYLFLKVLDDAKGNLNEVKKLAALAESIGWKAFLENRW